MIYEGFSIPTRTIKHNDSPVLEVRGLSFADISELIDHHRDDVDKIIDLWKSFDGDELRDEEFGSLLSKYALELLNSAPGIVANIIATCADCQDKSRWIANLPISIQVRALEEISSLTSEDFGGVKPMLGKIAGLAMANAPKAMRDHLEALKNASNNSMES